QTDVAVTNTGRIYIAINGGNPDLAIRGIWFSNPGNAPRAEWTRISGGQTINVDSVNQWRANDYNNNSGKRILISLAPSNQNLLYTFYENGLSSENGNPEADLFRYDASSNSWVNRSANMPDFPLTGRPNVDPISVQGGYDMLLAIKPDDPNFVLIGGTNLYRSTDGFASTANTAWIGGYAPTYPSPGTYTNSHPDMHSLSFNPSNTKQIICGNDGGVQTTDDVTAAGNTVAWNLPVKYQTLQYYYVAMDPETGRNNFAGGAQDNGTTFRDGSRLFGNPTGDPNNQISVFVNDGTSVGFAKFSASPLQQVIYSGYQYGYIYRQKFSANPANDSIKPASAVSFSADTPDEFGEFVTIFKLNPDNTEDLFYANFNRLFRTTSASTVTPNTWTEMTGVSNAVGAGFTKGQNNIRALSYSRGPYAASHALYIGTTGGKIFRLDNPRNMAATTAPVNITPTGLTGNVQDITVNPNNDNEIMAVVSNYGVTSIWWTGNAKAAAPTWKNAEGNLSLPSVRCCKIIVKKDASGNPTQEYYVGTSVGLYSVANLNTIMTANGTPTWQREGGNVLNLAVVVDMAYRPVDNTLLIGTHGNGMYYTTTGTPNFTPNLNTGINDPLLNDKNFITAVYPTISTNTINYRIGNMTDIRNIIVDVYNMKGQRVVRNEAAYQNGAVDIARLAKGSYILAVTSSDNKYRHVQKLVKQ
ncbi:MAG TPA: T9SS type A sorting domain-containing protein, partial [Chitinophagaceae bacterium]|nr:T9SS type A sorting domain-containing protein [Chitinophagaceae bacterium]